jgi:hypothetical protein
MKTTTLILWGRHQAHGSIWLKLRANPSLATMKRRANEGWELAVLKQGEALDDFPTPHREPAQRGQ